MELTSAETIRALMQGSGNPTPVRVRRGALVVCGEQINYYPARRELA
jgi:hypothetical protein